MSRVRWLMVVAWLAFVPAARAQLQLTYPTPPNGGNAGPRPDTNLPSFTINVTSPNVAQFPANVDLKRQDTVNITPTFVVTATSGTVPTGNTTASLLEGRNQIIGVATSQIDGTTSNVPATYPSGLPIFVDVDTGPPNNPEMRSVLAPTGVVTPSGVFRSLVTFNRQSAAPFAVTISGKLFNIPRFTPPAVAPPPLPEVEASIVGTIKAVQFAGSVLPPLQPTINTDTQPVTVAFAVPIPAPTGQSGDYTLPTVDFNGQADGIYEIRLKATDIAKNASPMTTQSVVLVNVDLVSPLLTTTFPPSPTGILIIDGPNPPPRVTGDKWTLSGVISDERQQGTTVTISVIDRSLATSLTTTVASQAGPIGSFALPLDFSPGGPIIPTTSPQDIRRIDLQAFDEAGNLSNLEHRYVIRDQVAPPTPIVTFPIAGTGTSAPTQPFRGTITNVLPTAPDSEEHGIVRIRLTITSRVTPSIFTEVETVTTPVSNTHDSSLDNAPGFSIPPNVLGNIPDGFTFNIGVNLKNFPFGPADVVARAVDGVGNISAPSAPIRFFIGPGGPQLTLDFANSGPDDNYQFIGLRSNQKGADDADPDGVPGFFVSLKSPEREDLGNPPSSPRPPPFLGGTDPGNANTLILSGRATDIQTPVALITASGPGVPTTSFAPPSSTTVTFALPVDIRKIPEGVPTQINLVATNSDGTAGPTTSVVVFRDVVPPRPPRITFPPLLTCLFGTGTIPCFFAGNTAQVIEGQTEPNALVVLSTPVTTGVISPPIPRTSNTRVPNPSSALSSLPAGFQSVRADAQGNFRFSSADFSRVATSVVTPVPVIFQAVDSFDNTDPVSSAVSIGVFRLDKAGEVVRIRLDPLSRNQQIFPNTPTSPVLGQFFGRERIQLEVTFNTVIAQAPLLTVQQTGTVAAAARVIAPSSTGSPLSTQVIVYEYVAPPVAALFDGPARIAITGGRDVFGFVPNPFNLSRAFFIDSVAPVLAVTGPAAFVPQTGTQVNALPQLSIGVEDRPAGNGSLEASCVSTLFTVIKLLGPLETNPTQEIPLTSPVPAPGSQPIAQPCGNVTITRIPVNQPTQNGTYEYRAQVGDNVGNIAQFTSTFTLDRTPITTGLIKCNPADGSAVTTLPLFNRQQAAIVTVFESDVDLRRSTAVLIGPDGTSVGQTSFGTGVNQIVVPVVPGLPGGGRADGRYQIGSRIVDLAGNVSLPNTCTFILDTTPPVIINPFPARFGCAGPPLRFAQVEVGDAPPNLPAPPVRIPSGVDLARTDLKVRMIAPDPLNKTLPGTEIKGVKRYRSVTGTAQIVAFEFVNAVGGVRALLDDGREDGRYQIEVTSSDRAGNTTTVSTIFDYDSQPPHVTLNDFPEGSFLADTTVRMQGTAFDDGPCGLLQGASATTLSTATVQVSIRKLDAAGHEVVPVVAPFFDFTNVNAIARKANPAPFVKDESDWSFSAAIPNSPGPARVLVRVRDRAGNAHVITRDVTIKGGTLPGPVEKAPPNGFVTADKTVVFKWLPVVQAHRYELELSRITPATQTYRTTFTVPFPFNEALPPLATGIEQPIDLANITQSVTAGALLTTASTFSWRMRSLDVSLNPGPFTVPTTFVVDPTPPAVGGVRFGASTATPPVVSAGTTPVDIFFAEDAGMDPSVPIEVFLQLRDPNLPLVKLTQTAYARFKWSGTITLPVPGDTRDPNGPARLLIRGARNLAGRALTDVSIPVTVNMGPFFQVKFFSNPAIPEELEMVIKATASSATTTGIGLSETPVVRITQQGHIVPAPIQLQVIPGTAVANSTYRTFFRVDPKLIGFLDFTVSGVDTTGARSSRSFGVTVAGELALGGVAFPLVVAQARATLPRGALPPGAALLGVSTGEAPPGIREAALARAAERGLVPLADIGYVFPDGRELAAPLALSIPVSALPLPPGIKPQQVGLYRATLNSTDFEWIGGAGAPGQLTAQTRRLGYIAAYIDSEPPQVGAIDPAPGASLSDPRPVIRAKLSDRASGVAADAVSVQVDGQSYPAKWDPVAGEATWTPDAPLPVGQHEVQVHARDRAGNEAHSAQFKVQITGPLSIVQAVSFPNPVSRPPARIRYLLTRPADSVSVSIYDVAGRKLQSLDGTGFAGPNTVEWELDTRRGYGVSNGVYLFTMEARDGDTKAKARGKIAVIR